jgi:two-component system, sensor histidine kinase
LLLSQWGAFVVTASSGQEALQKLDQEARLPDLILCDLRLRDNENGIDTIRRIRQHLQEDVPAVLISGDTATVAVRQAHDQGFVLVHKPVPPEKLRELIWQTTRSAAAQRS